jgi:hypothetical protein
MKLKTISINENNKMERYCDNCEKIVRLTEDGYCVECGKHADNMLTNEDLIKERDDACKTIIDGEILKALRGEPNDLV